MGVFTQDLAQDLPLDQPALTYVLDTVRALDPTITDQRARGKTHHHNIIMTANPILCEYGVAPNGLVSCRS